MDFNLPPELIAYLARLDAFIEAEIKPLQAKDDNERFFDHRREWARTDFDNGGLPRPEWEELLVEAHEKPDTPLISSMFFVGFLALLTLEEMMG